MMSRKQQKKLEELETQKQEVELTVHIYVTMCMKLFFY